ncbi:MAG: amidase family protein, partial [Rhodospirillales bacterium]
AACVAAGQCDVALGSDTGGSIRQPASFCGVVGLKPTYGRLGRGGTFPFVDSLDHLGPFARTVEDLALAYDALQGPSSQDHGCANRAVEPTLPTLKQGIKGLRVGVPGGWLGEQMGEAALARRTLVLDALKDEVRITDLDLAGAEAGRAAAYLITNAESSAFHLPTLRTRAADYDPDTRDRFLAGALLPAAWVQKAQRVRLWWLEQMLASFREVDLLVVPATPCPAPLIGQKVLDVGGQERPLRPFLGLLSQPFSAIGLPVVTVPVFAGESLPVGIQLIAPPWREDIALRAAAVLADRGLAVAKIPK